MKVKISLNENRAPAWPNFALTASRRVATSSMAAVAASLVAQQPLLLMVAVVENVYSFVSVVRKAMDIRTDSLFTF